MRLFSLPLELSLLLALSLAIAIWQRHPTTRGRKLLVLLCLAVCAATLGEWLTARGITGERVGDRVKYVGTLALAPLWLGFTARVSGLEVARRVPWFPALLLTPAACVYPLLWSSAYGGLFTISVEGGPDAHGPLWHVVTLYHQILYAIGSAILATRAVRMRDTRRGLRMLIVALVPMAVAVAGAMYRIELLTWPYDMTPVLLGAGLLLMRDALLGSGLLDPLPFPQRELLRQLPLGLVLTDRGGAVALINGAAARTLGVAPADALGRDVESLLAGPRAIAVEEQMLHRNGRAAGRLLVFDETRAG